MDEKRIKRYDELNYDEKEILDFMRDMKLKSDHASIKLQLFKLDNLIRDYEELKNLRLNIQADFFSIYEDLTEEDFIDAEVDTNFWAMTREKEDEIWNSELNFLYGIKNDLENAIKLIETGEAEKIIIEMHDNSTID